MSIWIEGDTPETLEMLMTEEQLKLIEYAAALKGQSLSDFVVEASIRRAYLIMQNNQREKETLEASTQ